MSNLIHLDSWVRQPYEHTYNQSFGIVGEVNDIGIKTLHKVPGPSLGNVTPAALLTRDYIFNANHVSPQYVYRVIDTDAGSLANVVKDAYFNRASTVPYAEYPNWEMDSDNRTRYYRCAIGSTSVDMPGSVAINGVGGDPGATYNTSLMLRRAPDYKYDYHGALTGMTMPKEGPSPESPIVTAGSRSNPWYLVQRSTLRVSARVYHASGLSVYEDQNTGYTAQNPAPGDLAEVMVTPVTYQPIPVLAWGFTFNKTYQAYLPYGELYVRNKGTTVDFPYSPEDGTYTRTYNEWYNGNGDTLYDQDGYNMRYGEVTIKHQPDPQVTVNNQNIPAKQTIKIQGIKKGINTINVYWKVGSSDHKYYARYQGGVSYCMWRQEARIDAAISMSTDESFSRYYNLPD